MQRIEDSQTTQHSNDSSLDEGMQDEEESTITTVYNHTQPTTVSPRSSSLENNSSLTTSNLNALQNNNNLLNPNSTNNNNNNKKLRPSRAPSLRTMADLRKSSSFALQQPAASSDGRLRPQSSRKMLLTNSESGE